MDYDPLNKQSCQTETETDRNDPEDSRDTAHCNTENKKGKKTPATPRTRLLNKPPRQTDLKISLVTPENHPEASDTAAELPSHQTGTENGKKRAAQRAKTQVPATDYTKLLDSFKSQSDKKSKQSPKGSQKDILKEEDIGLLEENTAIYQTEMETNVPLVAAATQVDLDFGADSFDSGSTGNDRPPDDF